MDCISLNMYGKNQFLNRYFPINKKEMIQEPGQNFTSSFLFERINSKTIRNSQVWTLSYCNAVFENDL